MEEFLKIDWHPSLEDIIDDVFINERRLRDESAMYRILKGVFKNPFTDFESDDGKEGEENEENEEDKKLGGDEINKNKGAETGTQDTYVQDTTKWIPSIGKPPPFKFPRASRLTKTEHATCLRVLLHFSGSEKPEINQKNRNELELYMKLLPTIKEEQDEFLGLAEKNWNPFDIKLIGKEYVNARWKCKVENALKLPRYYVYAGVNVPFNGETKIDLEFETTLLEMGRIPRVMMPVDSKRNILHYNINKLYTLYPVHNDSSNDSSGETVSVSQDKNCEQLAESNEVDLVISSGGLNCLAANLASNYNSSWILPIVVKGSEKGNIIYVDKPLPPISMTVMQKNSWVYKYLLKSQLLHPKHPTSIRLSEREMEVVAADNIFGDSYVDELLRLEEENEKFTNYVAGKKSDKSESFENLDNLKEKSISNNVEDEGNFTASSGIKGESDSPETEEQPNSLDADNSSTVQENYVENEEVSMDFTCTEDSEDVTFTSNEKIAKSNDEDEASMEIDSPEDEAPCANLEANTNNKKDEITVQFHSPEDTATSSNIKVHENDERDETEKEDTVEPKSSGFHDSSEVEVPPQCFPAGTNFTYRTFLLNPSEDTSNDVTKCKVDRYRILVRTRIDGVEKTGKKATQRVMLLPKLEHQVRLGAEAVTAEEALKQWMALTYRPDASLVRVRISAENSEIIQIERRTAISVNNEIKRLYKMNAEDSMITLHNLVHDLKTLKPGKYILRHTPSNGAFATVYQEADNTGKNVFDLHATYSVNNFQTIQNSPWPTIDRVVVTPALAHYERMPAMYFPPRTNSTGLFKIPRGRGRGRARGRGGTSGRGRGSHTDGGGGNSQDGNAAPGGGNRVRTKPAKKKKNKKSGTEDVQQP